MLSKWFSFTKTLPSPTFKLVFQFLKIYWDNRQWLVKNIGKYHAWLWWSRVKYWIYHEWRSTRRNIFWYYNTPPWYITNKISLSVVYWKIFTTMVNIFQYTSPWSKKLFLEWKSYIFLLLSHHFIEINVNRQWLVKNIGKYHLWLW